MDNRQGKDKLVTVKHKTCFGPYDWCGDCYNSGYFLTSKKERNICALSGNAQMIKIDIEMSQSLLNQIDNIEVYDETGFLAHYTYEKLETQRQRFFFQLKYVDSLNKSTNMIIKFQKFLPRHKNSSPFSRSPRKTIHQETITIPVVDVKGDHDCAFCLEPVDMKLDGYLSECSHLFHSTCIFKYLTTKKYLKEHTCSRFCKHSNKVKPFPCSICNDILEDNF